MDAAPTATDVVNYNVYYNSGGGNIADIAAASYLDVAAWVVADATKNANSLTGDPSFLSPTDLHLAGTIANNAGTPIAGITTDIDGDTRSATTPDIGADEYTPPSCVPPGALTVSALATSADLGWTLGGTETMWDVEYGAAGFTQGAGTMVTATTSNPYTATMLTPNTAYEFYVRANCGGGNGVSPWIGPFAFSTACVAFTAPYTESFTTSSTPSCWSQSATSGGPWAFAASGGVNTVQCSTGPTDHTGNGGNYAWMDHSSSDAGVVLEMNDINVSTLTTPYLEFYYWMCGVGYSPINPLFIEAWDGTTWNIVGSVNQATAGWESFGFNLSTHVYNTNLVRIRFRTESGGSIDDYYGDPVLDDISVIEAPSCVTPTALMASNITTTSATLGWTENGTATSWQVEYGVTGFTPGTGTAAIVSVNPHPITGLTFETNYDFYVRAICAPGDTSP
ncbi:MAG: hypothetical protein HC803_08370, partial [Saprospiraceae bacterium]|nr:hypothetical protein [Saprospiraceae bacterium]